MSATTPPTAGPSAAWATTAFFTAAATLASGVAFTTGEVLPILAALFAAVAAAAGAPGHGPATNPRIASATGIAALVLLIAS